MAVAIGGLLGLATVPEYGLFQCAGTTVVQETGLRIHHLGQANAPERRCSPFVAVGQELIPAIRQGWAHIVEQQIRVGPDSLIAQVRAVSYFTRLVSRSMTASAASFVEQFCPLLNRFRLKIAPGRNGEALGIEGNGTVNEKPESFTIYQGLRMIGLDSTDNRFGF